MVREARFCKGQAPERGRRLWTSVVRLQVRCSILGLFLGSEWWIFFLTRTLLLPWAWLFDSAPHQFPWDRSVKSGHMERKKNWSQWWEIEDRFPFPFEINVRCIKNIKHIHPQGLAWHFKTFICFNSWCSRRGFTRRWAPVASWPPCAFLLLLLLGWAFCKPREIIELI